MQGLISWYYSYAVPICVVICAMVALTTGLISKKIATGIQDVYKRQRSEIAAAVAAIFHRRAVGRKVVRVGVVFARQRAVRSP